MFDNNLQVLKNWIGSLYTHPLGRMSLLSILLHPGCSPVQSSSDSQSAQIALNQDLFESMSAELTADATSAQSPPLLPDFNKPLSVLNHLLKNLPEVVTVYPSENYFYYTFPLGSRYVSGNLRFADIESDGTISIGYFDRYNTADLRVMTLIDGHDAVALRFDAATQRSVVTHGDVSVIFILNPISLESAPSTELLPGEHFISNVVDESGYQFELFYWHDTASFYYVLKPGAPLPEQLHRGAGERVEAYFGEVSRYCFVRNTALGRLVLVGVHERNIMENNWYDGPFDQVPPRLHIRDLLEEAYPYVKQAGGIDEHGNFIERHGQRVAISPYIAYRSGPELERQLDTLIDPESINPASWVRATYEFKKDWQPPVESDDELSSHTTQTSAGWPANHWARTSRQWGASHAISESKSFPANHALSASREVPEDEPAQLPDEP